MFFSLNKFKLLIILFIILASSCSRDKTEPEVQTGYYLGTIVKISIYGNVPDGIFEEVFSLISDYENRLSRNISDSEISEINRQAGISPVKVSAETFSILEEGKKYSKIPGGRFDITIGPLVSLWGIGTDDAKVPETDEISRILNLIDIKKLILDSSSSTAYLSQKGMEIDCGAIAKGFIADRISGLLKKRGVSSAIINLGGNILTVGRKPDGSMFRIGIQDPDDTRGEYIGITELKGRSLVTSGIYERYFEKNGIKYHHILDPSTGYPVNTDILGITVLTDKSVDGDALSTTLFTMGIEKGLEYAGKIKNTDVLFISDNAEIFMTDGFKDIFTLKSSRYQLSGEKSSNNLQ